MAEIIEFPDNIIGKEDHEKLESYGAHEISLGRATRYHWEKDDNGDPHFELYRGGANEEFVFSIGRDRKKDVFEARDNKRIVIVSGTLESVMAALDQKLMREHGEETDSPA